MVPTYRLLLALVLASAAEVTCASDIPSHYHLTHPRPHQRLPPSFPSYPFHASFPSYPFHASLPSYPFHASLPSYPFHASLPSKPKEGPREDCVWDKDKDFPNFPPLLFDDSFELIRPVRKEEGDSRMVRVAWGATVTVACAGNDVTNLGKEVVEAKCAGGNTLVVGTSEWRLDQLGCTKKVKEVIHRNLESCGDGGMGTLEAIGFEVGDNFYTLIQVCFEPKAETTLYSQHILHGANIAAKESDGSRPKFRTCQGFFTVSVNNCYKQDNQLALMKNLLADDDLANTIIDVDNQMFFSRGHLAPDADFVTLPEQDATYYYINVVPQWMTFNGGNWVDLETATRNLAKAHWSDLVVYTGGWGVLNLPDINNNNVDIFLGLTEDERVVPAPAIMWKVVHEESTNRAVALVGINNPHIDQPPTPLCSDLCSSLTWIDFDVSDLSQGYTYCCTVEDLRAAIPHVPDLGPVDLLES